MHSLSINLILDTNTFGGFLECRIILPGCTLTKSRVQGAALKARKTQHGVVWVMAKPANSNAAMETVLESRAFFSTLEYSAIPRWPTDLFLPLVRQLRVEWAHSCEVAERQLSEMVSLISFSI